MSSHMFNEMEDTCDRVVLISDGHIIDIADMDKIRNMPTKDFKIEFNSKADYEKFKNLGYKIIRDQNQYNQVTIHINNEEINQVFKDLHDFDVKFISQVPYTLEKHFQEVLKNKQEKSNKKTTDTQEQDNNTQQEKSIKEKDKKLESATQDNGNAQEKLNKTNKHNTNKNKKSKRRK